MWEQKLVEGKSYIINNFKILTNQGQYRVCDHSFKLLFIGATTIKEQLLTTISMKVFKFKSIKDIVDGNFATDLLVGKFVKLNFDLLLFFFLFSFLFLFGMCD